MNATLQKPIVPERPDEIDELPPLSAMPSAEDYAGAARRRAIQFLLGGILLAALVAGSFVVLGLDNIFVPLSLLICLLTPVLLWRYPRMVLYVALTSACLFETFPSDYSDALTDKVPMFWNVNTIFQLYGHVNFKAVPLNLLEVFLLTAGVCSVLRAVYTGTAHLRGGALFLPILIYVLFVTFGWGNGLMTGGDFKISLQEVRAQFYFLLAYLFTVNLIQERRQIGVVLWAVVACIGLKAILYTFRRYVTMAGQPLPDQGVGSHEEAFFFDCFIVLLLILALSGAYKRLQWVMWILLPIVFTGEVVCNRRAGTAALAVALPLLFLAAHRALPVRRRMIERVGLVVAVALSIYYPMFKNSTSAFAQPARAIRSNFQPDERDAGSNGYRDAENADLMATIKLAPVQGYGYGKPMLHVAQIADISMFYEYWDILTHNQILWVWMRVGTLGFVSFWMMVSAALIFAGQTLRNENADVTTKVVGIFAICTISMLMIFGLLDLQLSNYRDMIFGAVMAGLVVAAANLQTDPDPARRVRL